MNVLLLVTQNEADILRWNIRHHLDWGFDHVAVADNNSTDDTVDVVREFGDAVSHRTFDDFWDRQEVRLAMLDAVRADRPVQWAAVADTDEFFWAEGAAGIGDLLAGTPADIVAVNFDMKLFLPTDLDAPGEPVFTSRVHRSGSSESPLHTSYRAGKTLYRSDWLTQITNEHWCPEVPHEEFRHVEPAVHHYMIQSEDQFVQKVTRLPSWLHRPKGFFASRKWDRTPDIERELPKRMGPSKREWWGVYQRGGEEGVREYYRTVYTLVGARREAALADGSLVADPGFANYARERYEVAR